MSSISRPGTDANKSERRLDQWWKRPGTWLLGAGVAAFATVLAALWQLNTYQNLHLVREAELRNAQYLGEIQQLSTCQNSADAFTEYQYCAAEATNTKATSLAIQYDLAAQQEMARWALALLIVSTAGFVVSIAGFGALLVSLSQTRDAIANSRLIGQAQVRAYLHYKGGRFARTRDAVTAIIQIENTGQSPASAVWINSGSATLYDVGGEPKRPRVLSTIQAESPGGLCQPISVGGVTEEEVTFFNFKTMAGEEAPAWDFGNEISFDMTIHWLDVFGDRQDQEITLFGEIGPSAHNARRRNVNAGKLELRIIGKE